MSSSADGRSITMGYHTKVLVLRHQGKDTLTDHQRAGQVVLKSRTEQASSLVGAKAELESVGIHEGTRHVEQTLCSMQLSGLLKLKLKSI